MKDDRSLQTQERSCTRKGGPTQPRSAGSPSHLPLALDEDPTAPPNQSMRFHIMNTNGSKRRAKQLKRFLSSYGYDIRLRSCQELISKMLGPRNWNEMDALAGSLPLSEGDDSVEAEIRVARREHQIGILVAAGVKPEHAAAAIGEVQPTGYGPLCCDDGTSSMNSSESEITAFEREWGLQGSTRSFELEIRSRTTRSRTRLQTK